MALTKKQQALMDEAKASPYVRAALDMIAAAEGTIDQLGNGYTTIFGNSQFSSFEDHPRSFKSFTDKQGKNKKSSAAGRYQIISKTFDGLAKQLGKSDFSPDTQDEMAILLLMQNGALPHILKGDIEAGLSRMGGTWAAMPTSKYKASQGHRSMEYVLNAYNKALDAHARGSVAIRPEIRQANADAFFGTSNAPVELPLGPAPFGSTYVPDTEHSPFTTGPDGRLRLRHTRPPVDVQGYLSQVRAQPRMALARGPLTPETIKTLDATISGERPAPTVPWPVVPSGADAAVVAGPSALAQYALPTIPMAAPAEGQTEVMLTEAGGPQTPVLEYALPETVENPMYLRDTIMSLINDPRASGDIPHPPVPEITKEDLGNMYLMQELERIHAEQNAKFLGMGALPSYYDKQLLELINNTPIPQG